MEATELLSYLNKPETLRGKALPVMEDLASRYPYFGIAQCLLAVAYQNEGDERYDRQLKRAACAIPNRGRLRLLTLMAKNHHDDSFFKFIDSVKIKESEEISDVIPEKTFIIPEINLSGSHEELSTELALLDE